MRWVFGLVLVAGVAHADATSDEVAKRFDKDAKAQKLAVDLYADTGDVVKEGPELKEKMGFRGEVHLVPHLPTGDDRQHLVWVASAARAWDAFFAAQFPKEGKAKPSYRWRDLTFQFVKNADGKHTPSAYAASWVVTYNVSGSLLTSEAAVLDTLWHELFHVNDEAHHDWSKKTLDADYQAIVKKCGDKTSCLEPYAPNATVVRGGTYYAFTQNNGDPVHEYAAELAVRYFDEQRAMQKNGKLGKKAFKCGPAENGRAWKAMVDEFFGGRDLVPSC